MLRKGKKTGSWSLQAADYDVDVMSPLYNIIINKFTCFNVSNTILLAYVTQSTYSCITVQCQ